MNNSNFGILLLTKNTYSMVDEWFSLSDYSGIPILNIDLASENDYLKIGQQICKRKNIYFQKSNNTSMQSTLDQALDFFHKILKIDWVLFMHHDAFPMTNKTLNNLKTLISNSKKLQNYGVIGFNVYHDKFDLLQFNINEPKLMTTARTPLELGNGYYNRRVDSRVNYDRFEIHPFAVESVFWSTALINYNQFQKFITVDSRFNFFHSWDDIAFQFMSNNIHNIVIPNIEFGHDQSLKIKHKLPFSSPDKKTRKLYGNFNHLKIWSDKWKFEYSLSKKIFGGDFFINKDGLINKIIFVLSNYTGLDFASSLETVSRSSYKKNFLGSYNLFDQFYYHDPKLGPLKYLDI